MAEKRKRGKVIDKCCPDCGCTSLMEVLENFNKNSVIYTDKYIECSECGYKEKIKISPKHYKDLYNPHY